MNVLFQALAEHLNSAVFLLLVLLVAFFVMMWKLAIWLGGWKQRESSFERMENDIHSFKGDFRRLESNIDAVKGDVEAIKENVGVLSGEVEVIKENMGALSGEVKNIRSALNQVFDKTVDKSVVKPSSPLSLTDIGNEVSSVIEAPRLLAVYGQRLSAIVEQSGAKNAYDIQQACLQAAWSDLPDMMTEDELTVVKDQAFKHGLLLDNVLSIVGVLLRDKMFKEKGIGIEITNPNDTGRGALADNA